MKTEKKIRILIVDDHIVIREGLAAIFSLQPDLEVVGQAGDGIQALEQFEETQPDLVLMNLRMPRMDGLTATSKIMEISPDARILIYTMGADPATHARALQAGARGVILKDAPAALLVQAIRDAANDRPVSTNNTIV